MDGKPTVIIDPGHGGDEPGAVFEGRKEKEDTLRLALAVGDILEEAGVQVLYTRTTDQTQTPAQKAAIANRSNADFFISLHRNAMPVPGSGAGALNLVYEMGGEAEAMAKNIQQGLVKVGFADLGVQERPGLVVLNRTRMPAVLVEAGFIDIPADNKIFDQSFSAVAQGIAQGILTTLREMERPVYYQVQVAAYQDRQAAQQLEDTLTGQGFPAFLVYEDGLYKVRVGAFLNLDNAVHMEQTIRSYGYPTVMVRG